MNRVSATLSVWCEKLRPERIAQILNVNPDRVVIKGSERTPPRPRPTAFGWHLTVVETDQPLAGKVLKSLIDRASISENRFHELRIEDSTTTINFSIHIAPRSTDISLFFDRGAIEFISSVGGCLDIEFFDL